MKNINIKISIFQNESQNMENSKRKKIIFRLNNYWLRLEKRLAKNILIALKNTKEQKILVQNSKLLFISHSLSLAILVKNFYV